MLLHMETNYDERAIRSVNHRPGRYDIEIDGEIVGTLTRISDKSWYGKAHGQAIIADEITAHWWVCDPWDQRRPWQTYAAFDRSGRKVDGTDVVQAPAPTTPSPPSPKPPRMSCRRSSPTTTGRPTRSSWSTTTGATATRR